MNCRATAVAVRGFLMFVHMRRLRHMSFLVVSTMAALLVVSVEARACPDCATALAVRASVFDDSFWTHLVLITLPLIVLTGISVRLYRIGLEPPQPATKANAIDDSTAPAIAETAAKKESD